MKIYDASAFFERILKKEIEPDAFVIDLTVYEMGNITLKHERKLKTISREEAISILTILSEWSPVIFIRPEETPFIYQTASNLELTFYDAAYIFFSQKFNATLETCDKTLYERAKKHCRIVLMKME